MRLGLWLGAGVGVVGRPEWVFVKLHTHGSQEVNAELFLEGRMRAFHQQLADHARTERGFRYYYVTAREMACLVHEAERGAETPNLSVTRNARHFKFL
jgi:hypothetical protein